MNIKSSEKPEQKEPFNLDMRSTMRVPRTESLRLVGIEKAHRLEERARELGGFSVSVVAGQGEPYIVTRDVEGRNNIQSPVMEVPEDKVIVSMQNTANPQTPTDLSELMRNL